MGYKAWVGGPWIITDVKGGGGVLAEGDSLTFELVPPGDTKIRISGFSCGHSGRHRGSALLGVECDGAGNTAKGETHGTRIRFTITESTSGGTTMLTSHPDGVLTSDKPVHHTTGGVCWTAEDGRSVGCG